MSLLRRRIDEIKAKKAGDPNYKLTKREKDLWKRYVNEQLKIKKK